MFVGDSITAGGGVWGWRLGMDPLSAINLGEGGLLTWQIANQVSAAVRYKPRTIVVMAGTNDAVQPINREDLIRAWEKIFQAIGDISVIVTLPPMTMNMDLNASLLNIGEIVRGTALRHSAKVIDLNADLAPKGVIEARYTLDGVHLTEEAYDIWAAKIVMASK